jgi:hypothetical protein
VREVDKMYTQVGGRPVYDRNIRNDNNNVTVGSNPKSDGGRRKRN